MSLLVFPSTILVVDHVAGLVALVVVLAGFVSIYLDIKQGVHLNRQEKVFFISVSLIFLTAVFTSLVTQTDLARGDRFLNFILVIPIYLLFRRAQAAGALVWPGLVLGALVAAAVGAYQVFGPDALPRAVGVVHPIIFGDLSISMGMLSFAGLMWFIRRGKGGVIIPLLGLFAGLLASALSLSRGGWVAIPVVLVIYVWAFSKYFSMKYLAIGLTLFMVAIAAVYVLPQTGVKQRVDRTLNNLDRYMASQNVNDPARSTSIGSRFEMWRSAWNMFTDHPLVGGGWGEFRGYTQKLIQQGRVNKNVGRYYHAHNEYLSILAKGGILSFTAFMVLFLTPTLLLYNKIKNTADQEVRAYAIAGLVLMASYASFALSEAILERSRPVTFLSFYLAVFMALSRIRHSPIAEDQRPQ